MQRFWLIKLAGLSILGGAGVLVVFVGVMIFWNSMGMVKCPAFDRNLSAWFPYQEGDIVAFIAANGQLGKDVSFDSLHIQHRLSYNSKLKCGTCGDKVAATFKIGENTLVVIDESGNAMFDANLFTALDDIPPADIRRDSSTIQLSWADSISVSGITVMCFQKCQGLIWYEQNKQRFYRAEKVVQKARRNPNRKLVIVDVSGCE